MLLTRARLLAAFGVVALAVAGCQAYDESLVRVERGQKRRASSVREEPADAGADADKAVATGSSSKADAGDSSESTGPDAGERAGRGSRRDASPDGEGAAGDKHGAAAAGHGGAAAHVDGPKRSAPSDASPSNAGDVDKGGAAGSGASAGAAGAAGSGAGGAAGSAGAAGGRSRGGRGVPCTESNARSSDANGHCYFALSVRNSWYVSRDRCRELRAHLLSIGSAEEQSFVSGLVGSSPAWIGLSRFGGPAFSWIDGQSLTYENWEMNSPHLMSEAAVALRPGTFLWFDDPVSQQYQAICERE